MKLSIAIITDNSEKWISKVIRRINKYRYLPDTQLIFIDNLSEDSTVPQIVEMIGQDFIDTEKYKFYINVEKKTNQACRDMVVKISRNSKCAIIDKNMNIRQLDKLIKEAIDDTN